MKKISKFILLPFITIVLCAVLSKTALAEEFGTGLIKSDVPPTYVAPKSSLLKTVQPASVDLSKDKYFPPIDSQWGGSCGSWATTYYQFTYQAARLNNWDAKASAEYRASPKWTYNYLNNGDPDKGTSMVDNYFILQRHGAIKYSEFSYSQDNPNNFTEWCTNTEQMRKALQTRVTTFNFNSFSPSDVETPITSNNDTDLYNMKDLLNSGHVLTFSTYINSWITKSSPVGNIAIKQTGNSLSHAMSIVGYDDTISYDLNANGSIEAFEKGAFKVANQYGIEWNNGGFVWVMYDALNKKSNATNLNDPSRDGIFSSYAYYTIEVGNFNPVLVGEITLSHAKRNDLRISMGEWGSQPVSRITTFTNYSNAGVAFDGSTSLVEKEGTFVFDFNQPSGNFFTDSPLFGSYPLPVGWQSKNWYIGVEDTTANGKAAQVKKVRILQNGTPILDQAISDQIDASTKYYSSCLPTSVSIDKSSLSLQERSSVTLIANLLPTNTTAKTLTWSSSNPNVATVSSSGIVSAVSVGTTIITAQALGGKTATCTVTVTENPNIGVINEVFPDPILAGEIARQLYKSVDSVMTIADAQKIKKILLGNYSRTQVVTSADGIQHLVNLTDLAIYGGDLKQVDVSKNTKLTQLCFNSNQLTTIDLSNNPDLAVLRLASNKFSQIDLSKNLNLTEVILNENKLTSIDLSELTKLKEVYLNTNLLTTVDVSKNTLLQGLNISFLALENIDVSKNTVLRYLNASSNNLTSIDLSQNSLLDSLYIYRNQLSELDVSKNVNLVTLDASINNLTRLDLSKNLKLTRYDYKNNPLLTTIILPGQTK